MTHRTARPHTKQRIGKGRSKMKAGQTMKNIKFVVRVNRCGARAAKFVQRIERTPIQTTTGITTTIVNTRFFRTELPTDKSANYAEPSIEDYDERRAKELEFWRAQNGQQSGDPAKLARALIIIGSQEPPPRRFIAGADAIATAEQKVANLKAQIDANRDLSTSLAFDRAPAA